MFAKNKNKIRQTRVDNTFDVINIIVLTLIGIIFVYPLIFVISASFSDPTAVLKGEVVLFPKDITFEGYKAIFEFDDIWMGYRNSIINVLVGVPILLMITLTGAFSLSQKDFMPRNFVMGILTVTMFFGGGLIPTYMLLDGLNMLDTIWALILPGGVSVYNIIVTRTYYQSSIPNELKEASMLDGCGDFSYFFKIVLPLSKPIIAVMFLFYTVDMWNMFFNARMYITARELKPLQYILSEIITSSDVSADMMSGMSSTQAQMLTQLVNSIKYGAIIVSCIPVLIIYPFIQKFFVRGIMVGAIKG